VTADAQHFRQKFDVGTTVSEQLLKDPAVAIAMGCSQSLTFVALTPVMPEALSGDPTNQGGFKLGGRAIVES